MTRRLEKTRTICSVTYGHQCDIEKLIEYERKFNLEAVAYILHDKETATPHFHMIWRFNNPRIENCIQKDYKTIGVNENCFPQRCKSIYKAFRYLTHEDEKDKPKYNEEEIKGVNVQYIKKLAQDNAPRELKEDCTMSIIEDIINGVSRREMVKKYGRDFVINFAKYEYMAQLINYEDNKDLDADTGEII